MNMAALKTIQFDTIFVCVKGESFFINVERFRQY